MKIVVGYDGSDHAQRALERATGIAGDGGELLIVSGVKIDTIAPARDVGVSPVDPADVEASQAALDKARASVTETSVGVRTIEAHGDPADQLVRIADEESADLIVVGTRGRNFAQRALLGSVSTKVVHHANCDVLVVR